MKAHLPPSVYGVLQKFVHDDHWRSFGLLIRSLDLRPSETVIEVGCGIGSLARHFIEQGFDYWGIDVDSSRIAIARERTPQGNFTACDAQQMDQANLPPFRRAFIHGVLHHLGNSQCRGIIDHVLSLRADMVLSVIEPYRPDPWWMNPLGTLFSNLDEGNHVRTLEQWRSLFRPNAVTFEQISLWPRWPVGMLSARLVAVPADDQRPRDTAGVRQQGT